MFRIKAELFGWKLIKIDSLCKSIFLTHCSFNLLFDQFIVEDQIKRKKLIGKTRHWCQNRVY